MPWDSTFLHDPEQYGGQPPMGTGPYGGTVWTPNTQLTSMFSNTYLHAPEQYGSMPPMGTGPYGGTIWEPTEL